MFIFICIQLYNVKKYITQYITQYKKIWLIIYVKLLYDNYIYVVWFPCNNLNLMDICYHIYLINVYKGKKMWKRI